MESHENEENDFTSVIDNLVMMFGHIITREALSTVAESCAGDLNLSVDCIMKITNEDTTGPTQDDALSTSQNSDANPSIQETRPTVSYAAQAALNRGFIPKHTSTKQPIQRIKSTSDFWTDQIRQIMVFHNSGARIMIILRGVPGSGKSYLGKLLIESMLGPTQLNYKNHILSADDYFMVRGKYMYDKYRLPLAHAWNQERAKQAAERGLSPIIIDNTNIEIWEMQPYVREAVKNGYIIEVVEPNTPWAKKAHLLVRKNTHNVPPATIKRMLDNYIEGVTGDTLMQALGLSYASEMKPPVKRLLPPIINDEENSSTPNAKVTKVQSSSRIQITHPPEKSVINNQTQQPNISNTNISENIANDPIERQEEQNVLNEEFDGPTQEELATQKLLLEAQKKLEEIENFDKEWENGEQWEESDQIGASAISKKSNTASAKDIATISATNTPIIVSTSSPKDTPALIANLESKPPRKERNDSASNGLSAESNSASGLMRSVNDCQDWRDISLFMPPWVSPEEQQNFKTEEIPIPTSTSSTCVETGDTNLSGDYKILTANPRNINEFYLPPIREKIPETRMLDKSTMTNEGIMMTSHCPQRERHFTAFRRLFKHIERDSLRYIFDNCCGDVNWAVEIVLGGGAEYELKKNEDQEEFDTEDDNDADDENPCSCLAKYEIMPNTSKYDTAQFVPKIEITEAPVGDPLPQPERKKKEIAISNETMQLKKQMEQNFVISDSHYSEHCLKIRKLRRGEYKTVGDISEQPSTSGTPDISPVPDSSTAPDLDSSDDEDDDDGYCNISESDRIVNINVGEGFIRHLDNMFGRKDMEYPENISFNISIPTSLLNEINALWMESIMFQLDDYAKKSAAMLKQDEEFARQLVIKEEELLLSGKEPEVPDLKEIMDLEVALSIHLKDVSEWKNNIPNDLAAKMTQNKLFHLFPDINKETLLEMLVAHNNDFKATVEVLLVSTGRNDIVEAENGINKFVMEKELERQEKMLEEQRKELSKVEWPPLPKDETVNMATVKAYRDQADQHLHRRNTYMQRAEEFVRRGVFQVASYYSDVATLHKTKYEHANSMAVASLMQYHSNKNPNGETVDLHYFRVKEAKETMDIFIDTHINKLRETNKRAIMLFFITGRGLHSPGRPKVKPACIKRLQERGLTFIECNPGLLRTRVTCDDKLTYQLI